MSAKPGHGSVLLVHWDEAEARDLSATLQEHGWDASIWKPTRKISDIRELSPAAVVISLRRLPSHGREVADALWYTKWGRTIPIAFFDGAPDKVDATCEKFPAAHYTSWDALPALLRRITTEARED